MERDLTLISGTFDTTEVAPGANGLTENTCVADFKDLGRNPSGIADWEQKFEMVQQYRREVHRERQQMLGDIATKLAEQTHSKGND